MSLPAIPVTVFFGWVVSTRESPGPFVIGPFDDDVSANLWRNAITPHLVEELFFHGATVIFPADSYTSATHAARESGHPGV